VYFLLLILVACDINFAKYLPFITRYLTKPFKPS